MLKKRRGTEGPHWKRTRFVSLNTLVTFVLVNAMLVLNSGRLLALEISDTPLESAVFSPPLNIMWVLDNSGSMDWEFVTPEQEGLFQGAMYIFAPSTYQPHPDHRYNSAGSLTPVQQRAWRSQWAGYNRIYFDPQKSYTPWSPTPRYTFEPADLYQPWSNPLRTHVDHARIDLSAEYYSVRSGAEMIRIANAHYFTHDDLNRNGIRDPGERVYLVTWVDEDNDQRLDISGSDENDRRHYYHYVDDGDDQVEDNELVPVTTQAERDRIRPSVVTVDGRFVRFQTDREALQNFANWCTYYRRRLWTLKAVTAQAIAGVQQVNVGLCAVNGAPRIGVQPVRVQAGDTFQDHTDRLLDALYAMQNIGRTPLRGALDRVGRYYRGDTSTGIAPAFSPPQIDGTCRRHVALVVSDGYWNGDFSGLGNADGDNHADTLADVAEHYYETDLAPDCEDNVPALGCDTAHHQHMQTLALSFGVSGTIGIIDMDGNGRPDAPAYKDNECMDHQGATMLPWPKPVPLPGREVGGAVLPTGSPAGTLLDDLWHAAINGRGRSYAMAEAPDLQRALVATQPQNPQPVTTQIVTTLYQDRWTSGNILYRTAYDPGLWQGEVTAWGFDEENNEPFGRLLWRASDQFQPSELDSDRRCVITYGGAGGPTPGIPFRYPYLGRELQWRLEQGFSPREDTVQMAQDLVDYVRGAASPHFRSRSHLLGDMVHTTPAVVGNTLFVGANDGMLHALDAQSGQERFAYVPAQVFGNLKDLSDPSYGNRHRYYVDGPLWSGEVAMEQFRRHSYLVGALGQGGPGYFCLLTGTRSRARTENGYGRYQWTFHVDQLATPADEELASQLVQWEYPRLDSATDGMDNNGDGHTDEPGETDPDIGFAFGQGYAVNANRADARDRAVVIFGNGLNSPGQRAVLYILSADRGEIVRKIDTGVAQDNGLSTPALIDVNRDNRIDYAYAGDQQGNLWKFDLSADDPHLWGVAYGEDRNGDAVIDAAAGDLPLPVFQARGQPISGRPDIMAMATACNPEANGYMVIFGTGRYLGIGDHHDTGQQSIYGIWDYGDDSDNSEHLGFMLDRSRGLLSSGLQLVPQTVTGQTTEAGITARQISRMPVSYATTEDRSDPRQHADPDQQAGWFIDFPIAPDPLADAGERVTGRVILRAGKVVVTSLVPTQTSCRSGGSSWLYLLNGCSGSQPEDRAHAMQGATRYTGRILAPPVILKDPARSQRDLMLIPDSTGGIMTEAMVGEFWGQAYWWQNID